MDDLELSRCSTLLGEASTNCVSNESIDATNMITVEDRGDHLNDDDLVETNLIDKSTECSSVEQDPAPLERLLGDGIMSPISVRRDSLDVWSSMKKDQQPVTEDDSDSSEEQRVPPREEDMTSECHERDDEEHGLMAPRRDDHTQQKEITILQIDDPPVETSSLQDSNECQEQGTKPGNQYAEGTDSDFVETPQQRLSSSEEGRFYLTKGIDDLNCYEDQDDEVNISVRSLSKVLNESAGSAFSVDISSTKKKIDESSHAFMEQLRGAANRRKNQVIRSRDSLRAKQKERAETAILVDTVIETAEGHAVKSREKQPIKPFKALPMPSTLGSGQVGVPKVSKRPQTTPFSPLLGARRQQKVSVPAEYGSGQVGVPMIDKRPPTTPFSPLLGAKRLQKVVVPALQKKPPHMLQRREKSHHQAPQMFRDSDAYCGPRVNAPQPVGPSFKARPLPSGFARSGAGQMGIPKISKRPPTVALSPMLGFRRKGGGAKGSHAVFQKSDSSIQSLVGLDLLSPGPDAEISNLENVQPSENNTPMRQLKDAYVPHSTKRAQERAQYNRRRAENEAKKTEMLKLAWKREIAAKKTEIAILREQL